MTAYSKDASQYFPSQHKPCGTLQCPASWPQWCGTDRDCQYSHFQPHRSQHTGEPSIVCKQGQSLFSKEGKKKHSCESLGHPHWETPKLSGSESPLTERKGKTENSIPKGVRENPVRDQSRAEIQEWHLKVHSRLERESFHLPYLFVNKAMGSQSAVQLGGIWGYVLGPDAGVWEARHIKLTVKEIGLDGRSTGFPAHLNLSA